jgi:SAM-dependent methyltransferase
MADFKDHFSAQAEIYRRYRPQYPAELFEYLSSLISHHDLAWDCGTGNGQCAMALVRHFKMVFASDPSAAQITNATPHERITYKIEKAEASSLKEQTVDLVTVANALHWFHFDQFYAEAKRVLKKNGIIAAWAYKTPTVSPAIDEVVSHFHNVLLNDYWLPENRLIESDYNTVPFPFSVLATPSFQIKKELTLDEFLGHLRSWSATQRYIDKNENDPVEKLKMELQTAWNESEKKEVTWPLIMKVGKNA